MVRKQPARLRSLMMCRGSSGLRALVCHHTKTVSRTIPPARRPQHQGVRPAARLRLAEAVDDRDQAAAAEHRAGHVEPDVRVAGAVVQQYEAADDGDDGDGDVDVQAPAPVEVLGEQTAPMKPIAAPLPARAP